MQPLTVIIFVWLLATVNNRIAPEMRRARRRLRSAQRRQTLQHFTESKPQEPLGIIKWTDIQTLSHAKTTRIYKHIRPIFSCRYIYPYIRVKCKITDGYSLSLFEKSINMLENCSS